MKFKFLVPISSLIGAITQQHAHAAVEQPNVPVAAPTEEAVKGIARATDGEQLVRAGDDNYSFVLKRTNSGELMAWHQSHSSHASHASHSSHRSGY